MSGYEDLLGRCCAHLVEQLTARENLTNRLAPGTPVTGAGLFPPEHVVRRP